MKRSFLGAAGLLLVMACLSTVNANPVLGCAIGVAGIITLFLCGG